MVLHQVIQRCTYKNTCTWMPIVNYQCLQLIQNDQFLYIHTVCFSFKINLWHTLTFFVISNKKTIYDNHHIFTFITEIAEYKLSQLPGLQFSLYVKNWLPSSHSFPLETQLTQFLIRKLFCTFTGGKGTSFLGNWSHVQSLRTAPPTRKFPR